MFGPDRFLYYSMGDGGGSDDPNNNGQDPNVLLGKILRIDVNATQGSDTYAIPADNPFARETRIATTRRRRRRTLVRRSTRSGSAIPGA